jgi:hypothetical protein
MAHQRGRVHQVTELLGKLTPRPGERPAWSPRNHFSESGGAAGLECGPQRPSAPSSSSPRTSCNRNSASRRRPPGSRSSSSPHAWPWRDQSAVSWVTGGVPGRLPSWEQSCLPLAWLFSCRWTAHGALPIWRGGCFGRLRKRPVQRSQQGDGDDPHAAAVAGDHRCLDHPRPDDGVALGPALATLVWSISSYEPEGMRGAMTLGTVLSALSVVALVRTRRAGGQPAVPQDQRAGAGSVA